MEEEERRPIIYYPRVPNKKSQRMRIKKGWVRYLLENSWEKRKQHQNDGTEEGL